MQRIEIRVPAHTVVRFKCGICGDKFKMESAARRCEERALETKIFNVGDAVEAIEERVCNNQTYHMRGEVVAIIGPRVVDREEAKWICSVDRNWFDKHVFQYEVEFTCSVCKERVLVLYFAPELKILD